MEHSTKTTEPTNIFGLRYLEEEALEVMSVAGCLVVPSDMDSDNDPGSTHYVTNCDYSDTD